MTKTPDVAVSFNELQLPATLLRALDALGYQTPTDIQVSTIPPLLAGKDVLGHAPTGTGKTAAFALPILAGLKPGKNGVKALVLAPTRELAMQVAEAFSTYAKLMPSVRVTSIYGGAEYGKQIKQLRQGVDIVVGTPGRVMDHIRRGTLDLSSLDTLVLDEADEMLRMGFIDDVQWILDKTPPSRRMALFSATMPREIKRIATKYLKNPEEVTIKKRANTAETIRQRFWTVNGNQKLDTLTRILDAEVYDGVIIFVRTKNATVEVAGRLQAHGMRAAAMNGDMAQKQREQTVSKLKAKHLDILVATDVAARGLDVERISHVVNYDVPYDAESYVHRIGRTGRAGRHGDAILLITPNEQRMLRILERATGRSIEKLQLPTTKIINERRVADFKQSIINTLDSADLSALHSVIEELVQEHNLPATKVAAALAKQMLGSKPLFLEEIRRTEPKSRNARSHSTHERKDRSRRDSARKDYSRKDSERSEHSFKDSARKEASHKDSFRKDQGRSGREDLAAHGKAKKRDRVDNYEPQSVLADSGIEMESYRVEVGSAHGVQASNIVGAIANEAGLDSQFIGRIRISDEHSTVELPTGMPKATLKDLRGVWVCNRKLQMSRGDSSSPAQIDKPKKKSHKKKSGKFAQKTSGVGGKKQKPAAKRPQGKRHKKSAATSATA